MADKIVSWGGIDSKGTSGMGVTGSLTVSGSIVVDLGGIGSGAIDGLLLQNTASATSGTQQRSPSLHFKGASWNDTSGGRSQQADFNIQYVPNSPDGNGSGTLTFFGQASGSTNDSLLTLGTGIGGSAKTVTVTAPGGFIANGSFNTQLSYVIVSQNISQTSAGQTSYFLGKLGVGLTSPTAQFQVKGPGTTSSTNAFQVQNANASASLSVRDDGLVTVGSNLNFGSVNNYIYWSDGNQRIEGGNNFYNYSGTWSFNRANDSTTVVQIGTGNNIYFRGTLRGLANETLTVTGGSVGGSRGYDLVVKGTNATTGPEYTGGHGGDLILENGLATDNSQGKGGTPGSIIFKYGTYNNTASVEYGRINSSGSFLIGTSTGSAKVLISGSSNSALFEIDSPAVNNILFVSGSGNVGIGTGTPARTLEVNGTIGTTADGVGRGITMGTAVAGASSYLNVGQGTGWLFHLTTNNATYTANSTRMTITDNGVGFGNFVANGGTVSATAQVRGSGTTSSTTALLVQNANATASFSVKDNGTTTVTGTDTPGIFIVNWGKSNSVTLGSNTANAPIVYLGSLSLTAHPGGSSLSIDPGFIDTTNTGTNTNRPITLAPCVTGNSTGNVILLSSGARTHASRHQPTSGVLNMVMVGGASANQYMDFAPSSGNAEFNSISIVQQINTSGSYSGIVRGLYYSPILTSTTGVIHRAIETAVGDVIINSGSVGIGTVSPSASLHVAGDTIITGSLTVTGSLILSGSNVSTAWTSYTPTWTSDGTAPSLGNGTLTGAYKVIGKTCFVRVRLAYGSSTTSGTGAFYFDLPFSASIASGVQFPCSILDNGNAWYQATVNGEYGGFTNKTATIGQSSGANSSQGVTGTFPFTFGTSDSIQFAGSYEIA